MKRRWDDNLSTTRRWCVYHPCPETRNNLVRSISRKFLLHFSRPVGDWLAGCEGISPGRGTKRKIEGDGDRLRVPDRHQDNLPPLSLSLSGRSPRTVNSMGAKLVNCSELMTKRLRVFLSRIGIETCSIEMDSAYRWRRSARTDGWTCGHAWRNRPFSGWNNRRILDGVLAVCGFEYIYIRI